MKTLVKSTSLLWICLFTLSFGYAQATKIEKGSAKNDKKAVKIENVKRLITSNSYMFKATYVVPMSMTPSILTSNYDVTVNNGSLAVYLPYFGRAYSAPKDPRDGGIKLNTTDYEYASVPNKKGGWEITIKPKKTNIKTSSDIQVMQLSVAKSGDAVLRVTSLNRQPISFNGYIEDVKI